MVRSPLWVLLPHQTPWAGSLPSLWQLCGSWGCGVSLHAAMGPRPWLSGLCKLFSISHLLPAAAIWLFPSLDTSSSHLFVSLRLHSFSKCGALAAAAISQPSVLQNHLCSSWDNSSTRTSAGFYPPCCLLPHSQEAHGECPAGLLHLLFLVLLRDVTSSSQAELFWVILWGALRRQDKSKSPGMSGLEGDGCHRATSCLCQPSLVQHSHGAEDRQDCV